MEERVSPTRALTKDDVAGRAAEEDEEPRASGDAPGRLSPANPRREEGHGPGPIPTGGGPRRTIPEAPRS
eukprot:4251299-Alexandrium_andersonii.AAC.1